MSAASDTYELFFIAIVPDLINQEKINEIKKYFEEHYNSRHSLRSPPHITLQMPFKWKKGKENILEQVLEKFVLERNAFELELHGYSAFAPRVIYIDVEDSNPLYALQKDLSQSLRHELKIVNDSYKNKGFHPHITVAFRDLSKPNFSKAWKEFESKEFSGSFISSSVSLLRHNGKTWDVYKNFSYS